MKGDKMRCKNGHELPEKCTRCLLCRRASRLRWQKKFNKENPKAHNAFSRPSYLKTLGWSTERYEECNVLQKGLCAICGKPCPTGKRLAADHNHKTKKPRELLCVNCNRGLGMFQDDARLLDKARLYLIKHGDL